MCLSVDLLCPAPVFYILTERERERGKEREREREKAREREREREKARERER